MTKARTLSVGQRFRSTEGVFTVCKINKKRCLTKWKTGRKEAWFSVPTTDILDTAKSTQVLQKQPIPRPTTHRSYPAHLVSERDSKKRANQLFIQATQKKPHTLVAYLDAEDANTSRTIHALAPSCKRIAINMDPTTCTNILTTSPGALSVFKGTMFEFVNQQPPNSIHLWMDYCCTPTGNKKMSPLTDIAAAVQRQIVTRKGGIAAFTFSTRTTGTTTNIEAKILKMFKVQYKKAIILESYRYYPCMVFFMIGV